MINIQWTEFEQKSIVTFNSEELPYGGWKGFSAARANKLKQCTNLRLHDENYTFFDVSLLAHKMGGGELLIRGGRLF